MTKPDEFTADNDVHIERGGKHARLDEPQVPCDPPLSGDTCPGSPAHSLSEHSCESDQDIDPEKPSFQGVDPTHVDTMLAKELTKLTMQDRENVYYDLHGVFNEIQETPEFIQRQLDQLESELNRIPLGECQAYHIALSMNASYVRNPQFRLRFLRADRFNTFPAAQRYVAHFEMKLKLFGADNLVKDIVQDDLDDDDLECLYDGSGYDLPIRDRAGRLVVIHGVQSTSLPPTALVRKFFYGGMVLSEDEETQRKGCVLISYLVGKEMNFQDLVGRQRLNSKFGDVMAVLPLRIAGIHLCTDSFLWRPIFAIFKIANSLFNRCRIREHYGNHKEILFHLQTFGIPTQYFPISNEGNMMPEYAVERWRKRKAFERMRENSSSSSLPIRVGTPGRNDILLGRGKAYYSHVGNMRLRSIVLEKAHLYEGANFAVKQKVTTEVVDLIHSRSGRFLKDDGAGWLEVDDETARKKVGHAFRTLRGLKKKDDEMDKAV